MYDQIKISWTQKSDNGGLQGIRSVPVGGRVTGVGNKRDECDESTLRAWRRFSETHDFVQFDLVIDRSVHHPTVAESVYTWFALTWAGIIQLADSDSLSNWTLKDYRCHQREIHLTRGRCVSLAGRSMPVSPWLTIFCYLLSHCPRADLWDQPNIEGMPLVTSKMKITNCIASLLVRPLATS